MFLFSALLWVLKHCTGFYTRTLQLVSKKPRWMIKLHAPNFGRPYSVVWSQNLKFQKSRQQDPNPPCKARHSGHKTKTKVPNIIGQGQIIQFGAAVSEVQRWQTRIVQSSLDHATSHDRDQTQGQKNLLKHFPNNTNPSQTQQIIAISKSQILVETRDTCASRPPLLPRIFREIHPEQLHRCCPANNNLRNNRDYVYTNKIIKPRNTRLYSYNFLTKA